MCEFRIGILGLVHDHLWIFYQDDIKEIENAQMTCAADPNKELLNKACDTFGIAKGSTYTDYAKMLDIEKPDACVIFAPSNEHESLVKLCAQRGIHAMVEKPMAATFTQAKKMLAAACDHKIRLMVNYPIANKPIVPGLIALMQSGELGRIRMFRWRMGHNGPENQKNLSKYFCDWLFDPEKNGGGALADFCIYGAAILTAALGRPDAVMAVSGKLVKINQQAEDNGVVTVTYTSKHKAIAILEGTWAQMVPGACNSILGDKGSVVNDPRHPSCYYKRLEGQKQWQEISFDPRPEIEDKAIKYFVHRIRENLPFEGMVDPENALIAQEIIEAAYRSIREKIEVSLPL